MPDRRSVLAWLLVAPWAAWVGVRVLGLEAGFPWVALMAFTPYVLPLALASLAAAAALCRAAPAVLAGAAVIALLALIAPRAVGGSEPRPSDASVLRVLSLNAFEGGIEIDALVDLVRDERVGVLSVQELTPELAVALGDQRLRDLLPHRLLNPRPDALGTGIYASHRLRELPPPAGTTNAMTAAAFTPDGGPPVRVVAVHAAAPTNGPATARWRDDLRALPPAPPRGTVQLLLGDFNATLDHRELRDLLDRGYRDAAAAVGRGWSRRGARGARHG